MSLFAQPSTEWALGVDVGGTKTAFGMVQFPEGHIGIRLTLETASGAESGAPFLARVVQEAAAIISRATDEGATCGAIGLSVCELVDLGGNITSRHRLQWAGLPVRDQFEIHGPTVVESDVRAAALAEARWGAGRTYEEFLYVNIGTGISACWVKGGVPHAGARGNALALASSPISFTCPHCGQAGSYVLEDVAGGAGLAALYSAGKGEQGVSAREVLIAAAAGDHDAESVIDRATKALGVSLGLVINTLDPEAVIVGGGLGSAGGRYWGGLERATRDHIWAERTRDLPIRPATLGDDSALIGAAARAWLAGPAS
jgi:glucokinase